jgi:hypothetical protein
MMASVEQQVAPVTRSQIHPERKRNKKQIQFPSLYRG